MGLGSPATHIYSNSLDLHCLWVKHWRSDCGGNEQREGVMMMAQRRKIGGNTTCGEWWDEVGARVRFSGLGLQID